LRKERKNFSILKVYIIFFENCLKILDETQEIMYTVNNTSKKEKEVLSDE